MKQKDKEKDGWVQDELLSVLVPVYNVEAYLDRCIVSIVNQTYRNLDIVLVNDGSTDKSASICDKWAQKDVRIKVVHKVNGGLVSARKAGIMHATGEFVVVIDSDDWVESNMFEEMMAVAIKEDADVVTSGCVRDYGSHQVNESEDIDAGIYEGEKLENGLLSKMISTNSFFKSNISIHVYNKLYKRDIYKKYQMLVNDMIIVGEDAACVYPCLLNAKRVVVTGKSYYHYCLRNDSIMGTKRTDEELRRNILCKGLYEEFKKHVDRIPNIMTQLSMLRCYMMFLRQPEKMIVYRDDTLIPYGQIKKSERVVIYGAGKFGHSIKEVIQEKWDGNIVAHIDKKAKEDVQPIDVLSELEFDKIIIAVLVGDVVEEIRHELLARKVDESQILYVKCSMLKEHIANEIFE